MDRAELLSLLEDLGRELVRLKMGKHVELARQSHAAIRSGSKPPWPESHIIELASILRVPPYHERYPVRSNAWRCASASALSPDHNTWTAAIFPGGTKRQCKCGAAWLVMDP